MVTSTDVKGWREDLAQAAQGVLDEWVQDEEGVDEELGTGGACQDVASALNRILDEKGVADSVEIFTDMEGGHVFLVANLDDGVFSIDIPPSVYETGAAYTWRKKENVVVAADDVALLRLDPPMSRTDFYARYSEDGHAPYADPGDQLDM